MKHIERFFKGEKGLSLYYQGWIPDTEVKDILLVAHGIAEHSGRYLKMASYFASEGHAVYGLDYRGHGRSEGKRCNVEDFSYYLRDFHTFLSIVRKIHPGRKVILYGHSMGAAIGLSHAVSFKEEVDGLIISGVPIRIRPHIPIALVALLFPVAILTPGLGLYRLNSATLSRDQAVVKSYDTDPLVYRGKLPARVTIELIWMLHKLENRISQIQIPLLILHGKADNLSSPDGAEIVYQKAGSRDKTLKLYEGFYHEILNEPEYAQVLLDMKTWLYHLKQ